MTRVKASLTALTLAIASGTTALVFAAPAQAATCYWYSGQSGTSSNCDGQDPDVLGASCGSDARTVASVVLKRSYDGAATGPTVDLRYSGNCRTVWARIRGAWGADYDQAGCSVTIHRNSDGAVLSKTLSFGATNASVWTNVLYDAGVTSYASGHCDTSPGYQYDGRTSNW